MSQSKPSRPALGIFWMLVCSLCFVAVNALVKTLGARIPSPEAAFLRYAMGLFLLVPVLRKMKWGALTGKLWIQFSVRGLFHGMGVMLWFFAITRISLADVTAINYLSPVYVTLGAALFLGERLAIRRIAAIVAALVGAAIILRPGFQEITIGHWAMMLAALVFGGSYLLAKVTVDETNPEIVIGMLSLWVAITLAPFAWAVWVTPTWVELGMLFAVAIFATAGHYTMTIAFAVAPMAVTQPITFVQLVWATLLGAFFFAEPVDIWVVLGGSVILAAISFITWRETVLNRKNITPPTPATKF